MGKASSSEMKPGSSEAYPAVWDTDMALIVGEAELPEKLRPLSRTGFLSVIIEMEIKSRTVRSVECRELASKVESYIAGHLIGRELPKALEDSIEFLQKSYYASTKDALIEALRTVKSQFELWKREQYQSINVNSGSQPDEPIRSKLTGANSGKSDKSIELGIDRSTRHGLATQLITLLAHARLLDDREKRKFAGLEITREARQQAIKLYTIAQQILHKVEAEPGLLEPQIEPIKVQDLIHRTLLRLAASGRRLSITQRFPTNLPLIRGDAVVLEEALFLLFDEMANSFDAKESAWEISAEKRKTDLLITIQWLSEDGVTGDGITPEEEGQVKSQLTRFWDGNLGAVAARTLVEHQGGRLWIQETFPQDKSCLCLSLRAQATQEETKQPLIAKD
ncbi:MAG: DUF3870 domain-containing protein [Chloroflexota bacterium]|jgi:hypothetical protein